MPDRDLPGGQHLAEDMGERQPQVLHVVRGDQAGRHDGRGHVRPAVVRQPYALGAAGGARGVDQGGELRGGDGREPLLDRLRVLGQVLRAALLQIGQGEHPALRVALGGQRVGGVDHDDMGEVRQLGPALPRLGQLGGVLRDQYAAVRVGEDERGLLGVGRGIDRGGGGARAHHPEVDEDPLDAGGGGERDTLLGPYAQLDQAGGHGVHTLGGLAPAQGAPLVGTAPAALTARAGGPAYGVAVGLRVRRGRHPLGEEGRHGGRPVVDQVLCVAHDILRASGSTA